MPSSLGTSIPNPALSEELAGGTLETRRGNKVLPLDSVCVGLNESQEADLLIVCDWTSFADHKLGSFRFHQVVQLKP